MRIKLIFGVLAVALASLSACTEHAGEAPCVDPKENMWWGYFDGTLDGTRDEDHMKASFKNNSEEQRTGSNTSQTIAPGEEYNSNLIINTGIVLFGDFESANCYFRLSLSGLYPGSKDVTKRYWDYKQGESDRYSTISLFRKYSAGSQPVEYVPSAEEPFKIDILDVDWISGSGFPAIEAKLDGTLYNKDNPQESITIHAVYGSR